MKFRKKAVVIEATQWFKDGDHLMVYPVKQDECDSWYADRFGLEAKNIGLIDSLEGPHYVLPGDWIITGVKGEHYACKPDIFELTYEKVEEC